MSEMESLLDYLILFLNQVREDSKSPNIKEYGVRLAKEYYSLKRKGIDCLLFLDQEFSQDTELYLLILSALFYLFKEKRFLDKAEQLLLKGDISYDMMVGVMKQSRYYRFSFFDLDNSYEQKRINHSVFTQRLKKELNEDLTYVPWEQRNHKRIILSTDTLLSERHAPTRMVSEIAKSLQEELGYEVQLLVNVEYVDMKELEQIWICPYISHHMTELNGDFSVMFHGTELKGIQQIVDQRHFRQVGKTLQRVQEWKPEMIWYIGGTSIITELLSEITTVITMGCTDGYAVSDAPILVSYMKNSSNISEMEQFIRKKNQKIIDISLSYGSKEESKEDEYVPEDFGLPENRFVIAIVGNRLSAEIDKNFIRIMEIIAEKEENVYFVTIGECSNAWNKGILNGRVVNIGYCWDLLNVLKSTHLFMNPVRKGGGGGAVRALSANIPVITLKDCDAAIVGEPFFCESLEEYPELVSKYCRDKHFYQQQVEFCRQEHKKLFAIDNTKDCSRLIEQVKKLICEGENND